MSKAYFAITILIAIGAFSLGRSTSTQVTTIQWPEIEEKPIVSYSYDAELVAVVDGDTVDLNVDLGFEHWIHNQRFRLYGIDTPETRTKDLAEKSRGLEAKAWLEERLKGKELVVQSIQNERYGTDEDDSFGRWLAILFVDGENVNKALIQAGHARVYEQ